MQNILDKNILPGLEILQNQLGVLYIIAGVVAIGVFMLILTILRRRRLKRCININFTVDEDTSEKKTEENYKLIIRRIKQVEKKYKSILFASTESKALPITIPVNVAIELAKNKRRCLLIDLDLKRDGITKAFGLNAGKNDLLSGAVQTKFENLWILPGHNFAQLKQMNIKMIVQKALDRFDFILLNAPSLVSSPDRRHIISAGHAAFICIKDASETTKLTELIKPSDCVIIGHIQTSL